MINKLYHKLVIIISSSLSIILIILLIVITAVNISNRNGEAQEHLQNLANYLNNNNSLFNQNQDDTNTIIGSNDYYIVIIDNFSKVRLIQTNHSNNYTNKEIITIASKIFKDDHNNGKIDHLLYQKLQNNNSQMLIMMDNHINDSYVRHLIIFSLFFGISGIIAITIAASYLSKWLVKPIADNFQKQKDFISDASHELKTPLTVISANCDLLESEIGDNKWLSYIKQESQKMTKLIQELLTLSRTEQNSKQAMGQENISELVTSCMMSMESVFYEQNIKLTSNITNNIFLKCHARQIQELVTILIDNAIKYNEATHGKKQVIVTLETIKNHPILTIKNTGKAIPKESYDKIFERFYRLDESHNREDGHYGLGLSIARTIVKNHNGEIKVASQNGWTTFTITF